MAAARLRALGALAHTRTHARRRGRFADNAPEWTPALCAACGHEDHDADDGVFCMAFADLVTHFRSLEARLSLTVDERPACSRVVVIVVSRRRLAARAMAPAWAARVLPFKFLPLRLPSDAARRAAGVQDA